MAVNNALAMVASGREGTRRATDRNGLFCDTDVIPMLGIRTTHFGHAARLGKQLYSQERCGRKFRAFLLDIMSNMAIMTVMFLRSLPCPR